LPPHKTWPARQVAAHAPPEHTNPEPQVNPTLLSAQSLVAPQ
jgi:hypothetical protein